MPKTSHELIKALTMVNERVSISKQIRGNVRVRARIELIPMARPVYDVLLRVQNQIAEDINKNEKDK